MIESNKLGLKQLDSKWVSQKGFENHPVVCVSWFGANAFAEYYEMTLPTEAQWEFAARGGIEGIKNRFDFAGSNSVDEVAWHKDNSNNRTQNVGLKKSNELGLFDMSGNIWEWCEDWYDRDYYSQCVNHILENPKGPTVGKYRVVRGGSWNFDDTNCHIAKRYSLSPINRSANFGFRVARY